MGLGINASVMGVWKFPLALVPSSSAVPPTHSPHADTDSLLGMYSHGNTSSVRVTSRGFGASMMVAFSSRGSHSTYVFRICFPLDASGQQQPD